MLKTFIVDDEQDARENLVSHLSRFFPESIKIVGVAGSVLEASRIIPGVGPDLLLLDIDLPDGTAFDILNRIDPVIPDRLIFITAYNQYAIQAIRFSALDYLLKPWDPDELNIALTKALQQSASESTEKGIDVLRSNLRWPGISKGPSPVKIALKTAQSVFLVKVEEIIRIESENNYSRFFFSNGKSTLISRTLKEYEELLSGAGFLRVHQSYLVNLDHIRSYKRTDGGSLIMADQSEIPVSHRKRDKLKEILDAMPS